MVPQLVIRKAPDASEIRVEGCIDASIAGAFALALTMDVKVLSAGQDTIHLDFCELELDDGSAVAETVNALRTLLKLAQVVVHNAPQMLAHTLYKTGMLRSSRLELESPRNEVPTAS